MVRVISYKVYISMTCSTEKRKASFYYKHTSFPLGSLFALFSFFLFLFIIYTLLLLLTLIFKNSHHGASLHVLALALASPYRHHRRRRRLTQKRTEIQSSAGNDAIKRHSHSHSHRLDRERVYLGRLVLRVSLLSLIPKPLSHPSIHSFPPQT